MLFQRAAVVVKSAVASRCLGEPTSMFAMYQNIQCNAIQKGKDGTTAQSNSASVRREPMHLIRDERKRFRQFETLGKNST